MMDQQQIVNDILKVSKTNHNAIHHMIIPKCELEKLRQSDLGPEPKTSVMGYILGVNKNKTPEIEEIENAIFKNN